MTHSRTERLAMLTPVRNELNNQLNARNGNMLMVSITNRHGMKIEIETNNSGSGKNK